MQNADHAAANEFNADRLIMLADDFAQANIDAFMANVDTLNRIMVDGIRQNNIAIAKAVIVQQFTRIEVMYDR